jgi:Opioid growth factor receptor (OGFr) conserved region
VAAGTEGSPILRFYTGEGRDHAGRRLAEIQAWDDTALERVHDYIQWLFPLPEASAFNPYAPLLSGTDIVAFREDDALRERLRASLRRILAFYGFDVGASVTPAANHAARLAAWCRPGNHNLLRITRILRCLHLLGLDAEARAFLAAVEAEEVARIVGPVTARFWRNALT